MHGVMIAIEYSYKLDKKNYLNLWCELGRLLLRQSHCQLEKYLYHSALTLVSLNILQSLMMYPIVKSPIKNM